MSTFVTNAVTKTKACGSGVSFFNTIDSTLKIEAARPDLEPDYERMRSARIQSLVLVDLPRLAAHRRRVKAAADAEGDAPGEQA